MRQWITLASVGIGLAVTLVGPSGATEPQLPGLGTPSDDAVARRRAAFTISCDFCHGIDARGGEDGPDLVRSEMMLSDSGGDVLGPFLQVGRPELGMPPFQMPGDEVRDIAAFVRSEIDGVINRGQYEIQNVLTGDAERGRAYFNGAGGCSGCHSPTGDLAGIANRFDPPGLLNRFLYPGRGSRGQAPQPREATVTLDGGQTYSGVLEYVDDFYVAVRDADGEYRSFDRADVALEIRNPYQAHIDLLPRYTDDDLHDLITYLVTLQ